MSSSKNGQTCISETLFVIHDILANAKLEYRIRSCKIYNLRFFNTYLITFYSVGRIMC